MHRLIFLLSLTFYAASALATEEPSYAVIEQSGEVELRAYEPMIIAETLVPGSLDEASSAGFRVLADYIFGNNTSQAGGTQKISMTAPVTVEPESEKINMTAPVSVQRSGQQWRVHFVMPREYSLETLPLPNNTSVRLREVPARSYAVIRFSGLVSEKKRAAKTAELLAWMEKRGITPVRATRLARYNPPWTLPFLRRNEIMVAY